MGDRDDRRRRAALASFLPFCLVWVVSGWSPRYPADWWLENALVFAVLPVLWWAWRRDALSRVSWVAVFVFLSLHEIGAHYTYSEVPYDAWMRGLTGSTVNGAFGWERNHFDRAVHFLYGVLLAFPVRDVIVRGTGLGGAWSYGLAVTTMIATSAVYELIEWAAAATLGGDLGMAYLGTQGDEWDGHRDMALASLGALLSMLAAAAVSRPRRGV
jgi:putative membrane protein